MRTQSAMTAYPYGLRCSSTPMSCGPLSAPRKLHQALKGPSSDGITVDELTEVIPADPSADKPKVDSIGAQIQQQIQRDLFAEYAGALRRYFPVEIDQSRLEKVF